MQKILIHYNEIALKGGNREYFEKQLLNNIRDFLIKGIPDSSPKALKLYGRFLVQLENDDKKEITRILKNIFGIANFSFVKETEQDLEKIKNLCWQQMKEKNFETFRISAQRADKNFPLTSPQINEQIGAFVYEKTQKKVSLKNAEVDCRVELAHKKAFIYLEKIKGAGGMPVGTGGKALTLLSGGIDSPVAAYYGIKRGVRVDYVHFHSLPYTSGASLEKVLKLAKSLKQFQSSAKIFMVPFAKIQQEIMMKTPPKLRVVLYRRIMMRIAESIAKKEKYLALYTGDSVGQVASQTLENIRAIEESIALPVLRPLIGLDKEEIIQKAKEIGTYKTSILPHEDCCTRFIPKNPETRAKIAKVKIAEENLDIEKMIQESLENMEIEKM